MERERVRRGGCQGSLLKGRGEWGFREGEGGY